MAGKKPKPKLTAAQRKELQRLASIGLSQEQCALVLDISHRTLKRRIADDDETMALYKKGRATGATKVGGKLFEMAVSGDHPACTMFYLKTQCGWRETDKVEAADLPPIVISVEGG